MLKNRKLLEKYYFLGKKIFFPGQVECIFDYLSPNSNFTGRQKSFCSRSDYEALFWGKSVKISSGKLECFFDNSPQSIHPTLCEFYKPAKHFSTTTEKSPPNVGRAMEIKLSRSNIDPRNVTLDMFTVVWTSPLNRLHNTATCALRMKS